jgi:hypothetical protein
VCFDATRGQFATTSVFTTPNVAPAWIRTQPAERSHSLTSRIQASVSCSRFQSLVSVNRESRARVMGLPRYEGNDLEVRLDIRGKNGRVSRVKILERDVGGTFRPVAGDFTQAHSQYVRLFAKVASAVAKGVSPPFNIGAILKDVNRPRRKKRALAKARPPRSVNDNGR